MPHTSWQFPVPPLPHLLSQVSRTLHSCVLSLAVLCYAALWCAGLRCAASCCVVLYVSVCCAVLCLCLAENACVKVSVVLAFIAP